MATHPHVPQVPGTETLTSYVNRLARPVACSLHSITVQQTSNSQPEEQEQAAELGYGTAHATRLRWCEALHSHYSLQKLSARLRQCGRNPWVERCTQTGKVRVVSPACKVRFCPRCARLHARRTKARLSTWAGNVATDRTNRLRLVTLTLQSTNADLSHQLTHLYAAYRKLRQRSLWKKATDSAIAILQVTFNRETQQWHPHLHVMQHGRFIDYRKLTDAWRRVTHGSCVVDIREVRNPDKAAEYVARYVSRPLDDDPDMSPARLVEYVLATKGRRLLIASGNAPLIMPEPEPDEHDWQHVDSIAGLLHRATYLHDERAVELLKQIAASEPEPPADTLFEMGTGEPDESEPADSG